MKITCISDLHGFRPDLPGGDLLIIGGDWTRRGSERENMWFFDWIHKQEYEKKVLIAGNHDTQPFWEKYKGPIGVVKDAFSYLCDSGTEYRGLKIWGSPWVTVLPDWGDHAKAFGVNSDAELAEKWAKIPKDIDILVTHSPPYGVLDEAERHGVDFEGNEHRYKENCGSRSLRLAFYAKKIKPKLHVFGHIHEGFGRIPNIEDFPGIHFVNAAIMDEHYRPTNKPIEIEL